MKQVSLQLALFFVYFVLSSEWNYLICEGEQFVVLELPLLFESGMMLKFTDTIIVVYWFVILLLFNSVT